MIIFADVTGQHEKTITPLIGKRRYLEALEQIQMIKDEKVRCDTMTRHLSTLIRFEPDRAFEILEGPQFTGLNLAQ